MTDASGSQGMKLLTGNSNRELAEAIARHLKIPTAGYIAPDHPVQRLLRDMLSDLFGTDLGAAPQGIDGCGIPVAGVKLMKLATAFARLADPAHETAERRDGLRRVAKSMAAHPFLVAGTKRFATEVMTVTAERAVKPDPAAPGNRSSIRQLVGVPNFRVPRLGGSPARPAGAMAKAGFVSTQARAVGVGSATASKQSGRATRAHLVA